MKAFVMMIGVAVAFLAGKHASSRGTLDTPSKARSAAPADKVKELRMERIRTLNDLVKSSLALVKSGRGELGESLEARMALLQAELDIAGTDADRIALCTKAMESMKELEQLAMVRKAAAQGTELDVLKAKARRLEIEIALTRFK